MAIAGAVSGFGSSRQTARSASLTIQHRKPLGLWNRRAVADVEPTMMSARVPLDPHGAPAAVLAAVLLLAACSWPASDADTASTTRATASVAPSDGPSSVAPTSVTPSASVAVQQVDLDGAIITTRSALDDLPERATVVRFNSALIDAGNGLDRGRVVVAPRHWS